MSNAVFIIAEAGVNHNGDIQLAKELIDVAAESKADAVKFQTFVGELCISEGAEKAKYQKEVTGNHESQLEMIKRLELSENAFMELKEYSEKKGIMFMSTPFDIPSAEFLHRIGLGIFKIPSGEITNFPLLRKIGQFKKKIVMSTGMCNMNEIQSAMEVLRHEGTEDLNAMLTLRKEFKVPVGYSDHTCGIEVPIAAVAMGASIIEKHFTLDKNMPGPDHQASLEPGELKSMISGIRNIEKALGSAMKTVTDSERENIEIARKSIVASEGIKKGEIFTEKNITAKRPGTGVSPMRWEEVIGKIADRDYCKDEMIQI